MIINNNILSKVEKMDLYLESFTDKLTGQEIRKIVFQAFHIDLDSVSENNYGNKLSTYDRTVMETLRKSFDLSPLSTELDDKIMALPKSVVMDRYIKHHNYSLTGAENRILINQIFGVNLNGISSIEHDKLTIHSKGQWITKSEHDLFILSSSDDDVSLYVDTTDYFKEKTGSIELPHSLTKELIALGFIFDEPSGTYTYTNKIDESVTDEFKVLVIDLIIKTIETEYAHIK